MGAILGFFSTDLGKYILIGAAALGLYFWWQNTIEQNALLRFNQSQMEEVVKNQKKVAEALSDIRQIQDQIIENEKQFKQNLDKKLSGINDFLNSEEAKKLDRPSSEILKRTVKEIFQ